jgi:DHA1 family arabinose polymer transporter-like MFS transporter
MALVGAFFAFWLIKSNQGVTEQVKVPAASFH